jgi:hypothetical protein
MGKADTATLHRSPQFVHRALLWTGWLIVLGCVLVRIQTALVPFPYWDVDPITTSPAFLGLGPAGSVLVDVVMMLGAGIALLGHALARGSSAGVQTSPTLWHTLLIAIGATGVMLHAFVIPGDTIDTMRIGATWVAAMLAGLAALHICTQERLQRLTFALGIGAVVMLAAKGALQVFIEHPATVEEFRANREAFFASQGWMPESVSARNFERRLHQPEATGWFGMANVYASFAAAGLVGLAGLAALAWREARCRGTLPDGWPGLLTFGTLAALGALIMAGGKGGYGAAALGLGLLALALVSRVAWASRSGLVRGEHPTTADAGQRATIRVSTLAGLLAVLLIFAALAAVIIIAQFGELSLLFRWFYMQGAARIFAESPLVGVGPAGFKDAYLLAKPPISPEEVASPHSILFDWAATLGLLGLAWCALWLSWIWMAGAALASAHARTPTASAAHPTRGSFNTPEERTDARLVLLLALGTLFITALLERAGLTPEAVLIRLVGTLAWVGVAIAALAVMRIAPWRWIGAAAVLALAVHAQIEVTPVWPGSAALFMVLIACIAAPGPEHNASTCAGMPAGIPRRFTPALVALAAGIAWAWLALIPITRWQSDLWSAAAALQPVAQIHQRIARVNESGRMTSDGDSLPRIAADVSAMLGRRTTPTPEQFERDLNELLSRAATVAQSHLQSALERSSGDVPTAEAIARMARARAYAELALNRDESAWTILLAAETLAEELARNRPSAGAWGLVGNIRAERAELEHDLRHLERAIDAWVLAAGLDPHGLVFPWRIFRTLDRLGEAETERGRVWARRVLETDERLHLDELRRLTPPERQRVNAVLQR